jgi:hypothetical protein
MFVYYFTGNFLFGIMAYYLVAMPIDRPVAARPHSNGASREA